MLANVVDLLRKKTDFYVLNMYYIVGYKDTYTISTEAYINGVGQYLTMYAIILMLIVMPAYVDESSYLMPAPVSEAQHRWCRGYNWVLLLQTTHVGVAHAYTLLSATLVQMHSLFNDQSNELMPLLVPSCRPKSGASFNGGDHDVRALQPSCWLMEHSISSCRMEAFFSDPGRVMLLSTVIIACFFPLYGLLFGRSFATYCTIGRFQLALVVLCSCTLLLHFFGAVPSNEETQAHLRGNGTSTTGSFELFTGLEAHILFVCIDSLGIGTFGITVLGTRVSDRVRQSFVALAVAVCFSDFGIGVSSSLVNVMRRTALESLCKFNSFDKYRQFMQINTSTKHFSHARMKEVSDYGVMEISDAIMMFRETSGSVPWTVFLPFQLMTLSFTALLLCLYFYVCDLQAAAVFKQRKHLIILQSAVRLGLLFALECLHTSGVFPEIGEFMDSAALLTFCMLRMVQCGLIHCREGFNEYLLAKRRLIPTANSIQLFAFDWYIGPAISYLFNVGYPLIFTLKIISIGKYMLSKKFAILFLATNALPSTLAMAVSHLWRL